jgi:hypothetical protein
MLASGTQVQKHPARGAGEAGSLSSRVTTRLGSIGLGAAKHYKRQTPPPKTPLRQATQALGAAPQGGATRKGSKADVLGSPARNAMGELSKASQDGHSSASSQAACGKQRRAMRAALRMTSVVMRAIKRCSTARWQLVPSRRAILLAKRLSIWRAAGCSRPQQLMANG